MTQQSEKVKLWRKHCKQRIIDAMGGACCICGYRKCHSGLALHHIIDLIVELQSKTVVQLSEEIGCSDAAIHKRLKKLGLK